MTNRITDISILWKSFQSGDKEAFARLYNMYIDILYRYGTKLCYDKGLVRDAIQEVFLDLYLKRKKNKTNPGNLKFYLILALKRNLIKKLKKNRKLVVKKNAYDLFFEPEYSIEKNIIEREIEDEISCRINDALQQLPSGQKEMLFLRFNESLEYNEISLLLNISIESARKQVYRALKTMRKIFKKNTVFFCCLLF